jgi:hypothetical protein
MGHRAETLRSLPGLFRTPVLALCALLVLSPVSIAICNLPSTLVTFLLPGDSSPRPAEEEENEQVKTESAAAARRTLRRRPTLAAQHTERPAAHREIAPIRLSIQLPPAAAPNLPMANGVGVPLRC